MKVIIFYENKFMKESFIIIQDVFSLRQSYRLSDLSFCNENIYGDFVRNERNSIWKVLVKLF